MRGTAVGEDHHRGQSQGIIGRGGPSLFAPETGDSFLHDISHVTSSGKDRVFVRTRAFDDKPNAICAKNLCISGNVSIKRKFYLLCVFLTDLNACNSTFVGESLRDSVKPPLMWAPWPACWLETPETFNDDLDEDLTRRNMKEKLAIPLVMIWYNDLYLYREFPTEFW